MIYIYIYITWFNPTPTTKLGISRSIHRGFHHQNTDFTNSLANMAGKVAAFVLETWLGKFLRSIYSEPPAILILSRKLTTLCLSACHGRNLAFSKELSKLYSKSGENVIVHPPQWWSLAKIYPKSTLKWAYQNEEGPRILRPKEVRSVLYNDGLLRPG